MQRPPLGEMIFFFALFSVVALLAFNIMSPYITPLFLAAVLAVMFQPVYLRLSKFMKGKKSWAAFTTVLLVLVIILVPLFFIATLLFDEVFTLYSSLTTGGSGLILLDNAAASIESFIHHFIPTFHFRIDVSQYLEVVLRWIGTHLDTLFSGIASFMFNVLLIAIALFFLFRDGDRVKQFALKWSPLPDRYDESIIAKLDNAISSVVKGALTTAIVQGLLVGVGFTIFGVPNAVLWGVVATIAALLPLFGTSIVTMPAAAFLYISGHPGAGIGLALYALCLVGLIDNVLHPLLIKRGVNIHPFLILLSVFGGLAYFGLVGFLAGPIVLAFFFTLLDLYPSIVQGHPINGDGPKID
jgi:predicted PurR-regulated permease PerM